MKRPPLNGTRTHPLTQSAINALRTLRERPFPRQQFNPGVANRLEREDLAIEVSLPSPYATHKGKRIAHLQITEAGGRRLAEVLR